MKFAYVCIPRHSRHGYSALRVHVCARKDLIPRNSSGYITRRNERAPCCRAFRPLCLRPFRPSSSLCLCSVGKRRRDTVPTATVLSPLYIRTSRFSSSSSPPPPPSRRRRRRRRRHFPPLFSEIAGYTTIIFPLIFCGVVMRRHIF